MSTESSGAEYFLGTWHQQPGQEGMDIQRGPLIDEAEFNQAVGAAACYRALTERPTYQVVRRNADRLSSMLDMYTNIEQVGGSFRAIDQRATVGLFMGEMVNWLASSRLYLERERDFLTTEFGPTSEELARFKQVQSKMFDTLPGYRFLYNLRDYAQHCGPPLSGLLVSRSDTGRRRVEMYLSRSSLLSARFSWNRHARSLIDSWPEHIILNPLVEEAMAGFRRIEDEILRILAKRCASARSTVVKMLERIKTSGHRAAFRFPSKGQYGTIALASLPTNEMLELVDRALRAEDPLDILRPAESPRRAEDIYSARQRRANSRAAAVLAVFHEFGGGDQFAETVNEVIQEDGDISPLISGLTNVAVVYSEMLAQTLGTTSSSLLGPFAADD